jgi:hypothetical protein
MNVFLHPFVQFTRVYTYVPPNPRRALSSLGFERLSLLGTWRSAARSRLCTCVLVKPRSWPFAGTPRCQPTRSEETRFVLPKRVGRRRIPAHPNSQNLYSLSLSCPSSRLDATIEVEEMSKSTRSGSYSWVCSSSAGVVVWIATRIWSVIATHWRLQEQARELQEAATDLAVCVTAWRWTGFLPPPRLGIHLPRPGYGRRPRLCIGAWRRWWRKSCSRPPQPSP